MSSALPAASVVEARDSWLRWLPIGIGLAALYVPTFAALARGPWAGGEHMHGPIVALVAAWLVWRKRALLRAEEPGAHRAIGIAILSFGLLLYVLGRSQDIIIFEAGSLIPVLAGVVVAMCGARSLSRTGFALLFAAFMLPPPGFLVDALTGPLKQRVSAIAEEVLYAAGYPIARAGVVLSIGPYQLLVADACSGLHSLLSMAATGLLYVHLIGHDSLGRNAVLIASLLPIAFAANVARVIVLVLATYHLGDEAGQGFIHGFSGIFLFVVGLALLFAIDAALGCMARFVRGRRQGA